MLPNNSIDLVNNLIKIVMLLTLKDILLIITPDLKVSLGQFLTIIIHIKFKLILGQVGINVLVREVEYVSFPINRQDSGFVITEKHLLL
jgi:hypothetical protein